MHALKRKKVLCQKDSQRVGVKPRNTLAKRVGEDLLHIQDLNWIYGSSILNIRFGISLYIFNLNLYCPFIFCKEMPNPNSFKSHKSN